MKPTPGPAHAARRSPALALEPLEARNLPSGVASLANLAVNPSSFNPHDILVAFQGTPDLSAVSPAVVLRNSALDLGDHLFRFDLAPGETVAQAMAYFRLQSDVRYSQPDYTVSVTNTPNDPGFVNQWGLNNTGQNGGAAGDDVHATAAWNIVTGGPTIVAVIDTGVDYTHSDLAANMWTNTREIPGNGIDDDGDGYVDDVRGWNFKDNNNNPMDDNGHGTHVAGIIGAVGNNGVGVSGVNWRVQIMPLKFLGADGTGSLSDAIRALNFAVAHGATVSNNSYAGPGYYQAYADAVAAAAAHGHIVVAAAGNAGTNIDVSPSYPAAYPADNLISVAALDSSDRLASFSNYGATSVDLGAPGVSIYSTLRGNSYGYMSGTSMAAPFVTGAVALVHDLRPTWTYRQIINDILSNTDPVPALQGRTVTGGRLDILKALGGPVAVPSGPTVTAAVFSGVTAGRFDKVRVTFSAAINVSTFTAADVVSLTRNGVAIPGISYTVTLVSGTNNQFDMAFTPQTQAGTYALTFGPDVRDAAGNAMNQNGNGVNGEVPGDRYTATATLAAAVPTTVTVYSPDPIKNIPDLGRVTSTLTVNQDVTIGVLSARVNITHPNDGDLKVTLTAPWGASVVLVNRRGGSGHDFYTVFDDRSSTPIRSGVPSFVGWYKSEEALAAFAGRNSRGTWTLTVEDLAAGIVGRLTGWSITVEGTAGATATAAGAANAIPIFVGARNENLVWVGDAPRVPTIRTQPLNVIPERLG